jgi:hypothetical protein
MVVATTSSTNSRSSKQNRCDICGRIFDNIETLNAHKRMEHSQESQPPAGVSRSW